MSREIALEERAEARADQEADREERAVGHVPRLDQYRFMYWVTAARQSNKDKLTAHEQYALGLKALNDFVKDINPSHLPPHMRNRREALLRRLWGE